MFFDAWQAISRGLAPSWAGNTIPSQYSLIIILVVFCKGVFSLDNLDLWIYLLVKIRGRCVALKSLPHIPSICIHPLIRVIRVRSCIDETPQGRDLFFSGNMSWVLHIFIYTPNSKARVFRSWRRSQRRQIKNKKIHEIKNLAKAKTTRLSVEKQVWYKTDRSNNQKIQRSDQKTPSEKEKAKQTRSKRNWRSSEKKKIWRRSNTPRKNQKIQRRQIKKDQVKNLYKVIPKHMKNI